MGLFSYDSVLEMNTKNMENSTSFVSITHIALSAKGLEVMELRSSTSLLISVSGHKCG
jgi:hypothetical protein